MYSLKNTITRNLTINMVLVMSALLIVMYYFMQQLLQDYVLTRLEHDAESLISAIERNPQQGWQVSPDRMAAVYDRVRSGHYYQVITDNQILVSRSLFDSELLSLKNQSQLAGHYLVSGPGAESLLVWFQPIQKNSHRIEIWVAEDIAPIQNQLRRYGAWAFALILLVTLILIYLQQRALRNSFYIFEWLRQNLSSIRFKETQGLGIRMPSEISPLVLEIEKLVEQLYNRIQRTRHAIGNLAHELKRPVQLLSLEQEKVQSKVHLEALDDIKQIMERELKRANISGTSKHGSKFNLTEEMPFLIKVMVKIYPRIQIQLCFDKPILSFTLDRDDMLELIGNLLDNACKFALTQAVLTMIVDDKKLTMIFEDDGSGLDQQQSEEIKRRGVRLDEAFAGHGLGLGISNDIVDSYQGTLTFARSKLGGLLTRVEIPLSQSY